jgi:curved DNA-binding protein CbpA
MTEVTSQVLSPQNKTLYDVLGVSETADDATIAKAYRQKSLALHPDRLKKFAEDEVGEEDKRALQLVQDAYSALKDEEKRRTYDFARKFGRSEATQEALNNLHISVATQLLFSGGASIFGSSSSTSSSSSAIAKMNQELRESAAKNAIRKCSCGNSLAKPDDLLCSTCSLFKPKNRCSQMGCLNNIDPSSPSFNLEKRTETCKQMCDKCAFRRKCTQWGCMKKCESSERDVCVSHAK